MNAIIIANGDLQGSCRSPHPQKGDLVIAADGGSQHCLSLKITPDILIGDLDSVDPDLVATWENQGVEVIQHSPDKDQTDLELALLVAQDRGAERISVYGAVGGRLDMTFGNLILLAHPQLKIPITLICGDQEVYLLQQGQTLNLEGTPGDTISLLPLHPDGARVSAQGVQYKLEKEILEFGLTRGISNQLTQSRSTIKLESGLLAVVHTRQSSSDEKEIN